MVNVRYRELSIKGMLTSPRKATAYLVPTAFSGLTVKYGADSCSDHPDTSTMSGSLFIPEHHQHFYPDLNDEATFQFWGTDRNSRVFFGLIDSLTIQDRTGEPLPAGFPNARDMQNLDGWDFRRGTTPAGSPVAATFTPGGSHIEITTPLKTGSAAEYVFITSPQAPVNPAKQYRVTGLYRPMVDQFTGTRTIRYDLLWYDAAGALASTVDDVSTEWSSTTAQTWQQLDTRRIWPPSNAAFLAVRAWCPIADYYPASVPLPAGVDGLTLHEDLVTKPMNGSRRSPGRFFTFTASDITATAGRLMIGGLPFPPEYAGDRIIRINNIVAPVYEMVASNLPSTALAYRDIDNQSSLDVVRRVAASTGDVAMASNQWGSRVIGYGDPVRFSRVLKVLPAGAAAIVEDPLQITVPASAIHDAPLTTGITGLSNQVQFNYRLPAEDGSEDATAVVRNPESMARYGPMSRTIDTDLAAPTGRAWDKAQQIAEAQGTPSYSLDGSINLVESQIPDGPGIYRLFEAQKAFRSIVVIPDAPDLLGKYQRIKAGTLTFGKKIEISLEVEPEGQVIPDAITWADLSTSLPYQTIKLSGLPPTLLISDLETTSVDISTF